MYASVVSTMSTTEARAAMPELLDRVAAGDEVTITRHGRPVAVVVRPDVLRARRAAAAFDAAARIREVLAAGRDSELPPEGGLTEARADELIDDVRAGRARR
jgi:antitoxin (DNA-binding transcriptional repressor) of toxin-antitoxin stability system